VVSPPETLAEIHEIRGDFGQTAALYALAAHADEPTLVRLIEEALAIEQLSERRAASSILYARYGDLDPSAAVTHAIEHAGAVAEEAIRSIFYSWSRIDLEAAKARIRTLPRPLTTQAGVAMLRARDDLDETERQRLASDLGVEQHLQMILASEAAERAAADPRAGWAAALASSDQNLRRQQLMMVAHAWARTDPAAALAAVRELNEEPLRQTLVQNLLIVMAELDPERALEEMSALSSESQRPDFTAIVLSRLAARDPQAAIAWFEAQRDPTVRAQVVTLIAMSYAGRHLEDAIDWASDLPDKERTAAITGIAQTMIQADPERAARLVLEQDDAEAAQQFAVIWGSMDPASAVPWIQTNIDDANVRAQLFASAIASWINADLPNAIRFIETLDTGAEYDHSALAAIANSANRPGVARLIDKMQDPAMKQNARALLDRQG
jgi:hypothetical protein